MNCSDKLRFWESFPIFGMPTHKQLINYGQKRPMIGQNNKKIISSNLFKTKNVHF